MRSIAGATGLMLAAMAAVPLAAQCPDGTPAPCATAPRMLAAARAPDSNSVAVLPFENTRRDTADVSSKPGNPAQTRTID